MPRQARSHSPTGIYHVMVRGVAKMDIFRDNRDSHKYLDALKRFKQKLEYRLFVYCLMKNHVHLLMKEENEPLSVSMKRIGVSYTAYFNRKYHRVGHVFQDRFKSQVIVSESQFKCCARYIHNNPVKALVVKKPDDYPWSSYRDYIHNHSTKLTDRSMLLSVFAEDDAEAIEQLIAFTCQDNDDQFIEWDEDIQLRGQELEAVVARILARHDLNVASMGEIDRNLRDEIIREIKSSVNCSNTDLGALLGLGKDTIRRA